MGRKTELSFSSIGHDFTIRIGVSEMSGRDKVNLFSHLVSELNLLDIFRSNPEIEKQIHERLMQYWN